MPIVPIRADNAYIGLSKQTTQGTPVAPSTFVRWLDGSKYEYDLKTEEVWEGDGTRRLSQIIKNKQSVKVTVNFNPRPIELGFFECAAMGIGSDAVSAPSVATTLAASATAGATSISLTSNVGLTGSGTATLILSAGTANEEVVVVTTPGTGAGPYAYTLANSAVLKKSHSNSDAASTSATHVLTDQSDGSYYTVEVGLGSLSGGAGPTLRVTDCKVSSIKRTSKAGMLLEYEVEFEGIATNAQVSPSTVTLEPHSPFLYVQGVWTLNGSTTGDALAVESFDIAQKNNCDPIQTEQLTLAAIIYGNLDIDVKIDVIMQNSNLIALTYWGGGTTDAQPIGAGSLTLKFSQPDGFHSVQYNVPTLHYTKLGMPAPKKDGKHFNLSLESKGVSSQATNTYILQSTVNNAQSTSY